MAFFFFSNKYWIGDFSPYLVMSVVLIPCIQLSCHFSNAVFSLIDIQVKDFWWKHSGLLAVSIPWSRQLPFQLKLGIFLPLFVPAGSHSYVDNFLDPAVTDSDAEFSDLTAVKGRSWYSDDCLSHSPTSGIRTSLAWQEAVSLKEWFS